MTEVFRAFVVYCPDCSKPFVIRENMERRVHFRCSACKKILDKGFLMLMRLKKTFVEMVSWDCEACGCDNLENSLPSKCRECEHPVNKKQLIRNT